MRLLIVSGFLGSGKTTLILALAKHLATAGHRTCFIVNEVGEIGIDQQVMREGGLDVWEITSGCICCSLGSDLIVTLNAISERFHPEVVIVEASGVSMPSGIEDALANYRGRPFTERRMLSVVDPTRLEMLLQMMTPLVEAQIGRADDIVVTKQDEALEAENTCALETAARLNAEARLWRVVATDMQSLKPLLVHLAAEPAS